MKALLLPILMLAAMPAQAEDAGRPDMSMFGGDRPLPGAFMATGLFLEQCDRGARPEACANYVMGLIDGFDAIQSLTREQPWLCLPDKVTGTMVLEGFLAETRRVNDNGGLRSLPTARTLHIYLRAFHACPKGGVK